MGNARSHVLGISGTIAVEPRFRISVPLVDHPRLEKCNIVVILSGLLRLRISGPFIASHSFIQ